MTVKQIMDRLGALIASDASIADLVVVADGCDCEGTARDVIVSKDGHDDESGARLERYVLVSRRVA